jgi:hypothetical protein
MPDRLNGTGAERWDITRQGRDDLEVLPVCSCKPRVVGLLVACTDCGTVYGHLRDWRERTQNSTAKHS